MKKLLFGFILSLLLTGCGSNTNDSRSEPAAADIAVIYFSRTGHTKPLAEFAQEHLNASLEEITAVIPYTDDDIKYYTDCRADREQNDPSARPEINDIELDLSKYSTIVLGYPIWHGQAPKVMYTFVEKYSMEGKTVLPFWTSASSTADDSDENLATSAKAGRWINGKRFAIGTDKEAFTNWLDESLDINKEEKDMFLEIDNQKIDVTWENNESVSALKSLASPALTINMHRYGGFEQTGGIGQSIARNDSQINTEPGDIVLYNGNQISVFYEPSSWSYTRLGHINMGKSDLNALLNKDSIVFVLKGA